MEEFIGDGEVGHSRQQERGDSFMRSSDAGKVPKMMPEASKHHLPVTEMSVPILWML